MEDTLKEVINYLKVILILLGLLYVSLYVLAGMILYRVIERNNKM